MTAPIIYIPGFFADPGHYFDRLWNGLDWERRSDAPRREYFASLIGDPYTYGRGRGERTYHPRPWTPELLEILTTTEAKIGAKMDLVFLNGYNDERDHLGWHADDSPEMDDTRPIAIISFGAERNILFKANGEDDDQAEKLLLGNGSLCIMQAGMQDTHRHKIPKGGYRMGPRISLTFRGYVDPKLAVDAA